MRQTFGDAWVGAGAVADEGTMLNVRVDDFTVSCSPAKPGEEGAGDT